MSKGAKIIRRTFTKIAEKEVEKIYQAVMDNKPWWMPKPFWIKLYYYFFGNTITKGKQF